MDRVIITDAKTEHIPAIERIEQKCFSVPWTEDMLKNQLSGSGKVFLAALYEEEIAGYIGLSIILDEGYISNVAVAPSFRGKGIGCDLISELIVRARKRGASFLTLEVRQSNIPARRLYEKFGFADVGRRKNYYDKPVEDAIIMTLYLK